MRGFTMERICRYSLRLLPELASYRELAHSYVSTFYRFDILLAYILMLYLLASNCCDPGARYIRVARKDAVLYFIFSALIFFWVIYIPMQLVMKPAYIISEVKPLFKALDICEANQGVFGACRRLCISLSDSDIAFLNSLREFDVGRAFKAVVPISYFSGLFALAAFLWLKDRRDENVPQGASLLEQRIAESLLEVAPDDLSDTEEAVCSICLEPLREMPVVQTACEHRFHGSCLRAWLANPSSGQRCPLCRVRVVPP